MSEKTQWKTAITDDSDGAGRIRGYKIEELIGGRSFAEVAWLLLRGELPKKNEAEMFDAILVSTADHGIAVPSVSAARIVASGGNSLNAAAAAGILAAGDMHGSAIEGCMRVLEEGKDKNPVSFAEALVTRALEKKMRIPGFGHKVLKNDPRSARLFQMAKERGIGGNYLKLAEEVERLLGERKGKPLPLNVDGAIAAILLSLGFPPEAGNAAFLMGRIAGICSHVVEERQREKPFRRIDQGEYTYDGPAPRDLP